MSDGEVVGVGEGVEELEDDGGDVEVGEGKGGLGVDVGVEIAGGEVIEYENVE